MKYEKLEMSEINSLMDFIDKIKRKYIFNYIGIFFGALIIIMVVLYYSFDKDLLGGIVSMIFIGAVIILMNLVDLKSRKKRVVQLTKDLNKMKELYEAKKDF